MTLTERLASLKPEIEQGLVKGVEIDKVINLADYFMHNKKRKPAYLWRVDLYYKRNHPGYETTTRTAPFYQIPCK